MKDRCLTGFTVGGTATYASLTALRLGRSVGAVTSLGPDLIIEGELAQAHWVVVQAQETTSFANIYHEGKRTQVLLAVALPIPPEIIPLPWHHAPLVLLAPVAQEVPVALASSFRTARVGATAQGWLRHWYADGLVRYQPWRPSPEALAALDVLFVSEEDLGDDEPAIDYYAQHVPLLLVTRGPQGATLYQGRDVHHIPAFTAREVDPTGAGDVFAASFLIHWADTGDPYAAAVYASCAASLSIEGVGSSAVPTAAMIAARLRRGE